VVGLRRPRRQAALDLKRGYEASGRGEEFLRPLKNGGIVIRLGPPGGTPDFPGNLGVRGVPSGNTLRLIRGNTR